MARTIATNTTVDLDGLLDFVRPRHQMVLMTTRADGRPAGLAGHRRRRPAGPHRHLDLPRAGQDGQRPPRPPGRASSCSPTTSAGAWVQVDGDCEVIDPPDSVEPLVEYFRCISGEHPDWDEYRQAMVEQGKSLLRVTPTRWGPVATGGFPARLADPDA